MGKREKPIRKTENKKTGRMTANQEEMMRVTRMTEEVDFGDRH